MSDIGSFLVALPLPHLCAGTLYCALVALRTRAVVGAPIAASRPGRRTRVAIVLGLHAATLALVVARPELSIPATAAVLGLGAAIVLLAPGSGDAVCGETGVQRGFDARRFEELEEWRLTGEHLRFRLHGEWTSVPAPASEHPRLRAMLESACAERESRFPE